MLVSTQFTTRSDLHVRFGPPLLGLGAERESRKGPALSVNAMTNTATGRLRVAAQGAVRSVTL
jgi:hypothetical protein